MFFVLCEFCKKDADKFKIYRRFCRPLNLKSRADTFKFDFNFNASKAPQER